MTDQITVTRQIEASADRLFEMVSDLTRMGDFSPENEGASWKGGATGPSLGVRFRGTNRNGKKTWSTSGRIVDFDVGRVFAFRITALGMPIAEWRYEFQSTTSGCGVTETWTDKRNQLVRALGKPVSGVADRAARNKATMEETLEHLKAVAEAAAPQ